MVQCDKSRGVPDVAPRRLLSGDLSRELRVFRIIVDTELPMTSRAAAGCGRARAATRNTRAAISEEFCRGGRARRVRIFATLIGRYSREREKIALVIRAIARAPRNPPRTQNPPIPGPSRTAARMEISALSRTSVYFCLISFERHTSREKCSTSSSVHHA